MKIESTKKILIISIIVVVILAALNIVVFGLIRNAGTSVSALENEVHAQQAQVLEFSKYNPEELKKLSQSIVAHFISRDGFVKFIEGIELSARQRNLAIVTRGVEVERRSADDEVNKADDKEIVNLKLETRGDWKDTVEFIDYLEHVPYKIDIRNVSMQVVFTEDASEKVWQAAIELQTLKFK